MLSLLLLSLELLPLVVLVPSSALVVELLPELPVASPLPIVESTEAVVVESPRVSGPDDDEELEELDEEDPSSGEGAGGSLQASSTSALARKGAGPGRMRSPS